ncbi:MAG TPA: serine/threonine-protein kinase [Chloroflexia bacterium]|jgi:WD40 repeat protein
MTLLSRDMLIHGRYRIVRLIGQGGFGAVYEVEDTRLERPAALKQLLLTDERVRRKFTDEARTLANLDNPHLPRVIDQFTDSDGQFLVMDYIAGDDLAMELLKWGRAFPVERVVKWGLELLDVLEYLHTHRPPIVHRDIKPQNLKLGSGDSIMLLDFGLAKGYVSEAAVSTPPITVPAYTKGYAAPEQVESRGTDARTDVYGFGATLYNLLTNVQPIEPHHRFVKAAASQEQDRLLPPHQYNPEVPETLSRVLLAAMALEPDDRPTVGEMRQSLQKIRSGLQPSVRPGIATVSDWTARTEIDPTVIDLAPTVMDLTVSERSEELSDLYSQARRYYNAKEWALVVTIFGRIVAIDPEYPDQEGLLAGAQAALNRSGKRDRPIQIWKYLVVGVAGLLIAALLVFIAWRMAEPVYSLVATFKGHGSFVRAVDFSSDGKTLASASFDGTVKLWQIGDSIDPQTLQEDNFALGVAFSPDGQILASASSGGTVKLWRASDGVVLRILSGHEDGVNQVAFSPDGQMLASASSDSTIKLWRVSDGTELMPLTEAAGIMSSHTVYDVAFAPDGNTLASASFTTVKLWRVSDGAEMRTLLMNSEHLVFGVAFSPDGQILASASADGTVKLWRASDGVELRTLSGHEVGVNQVAFSPDGQMLASASSDSTIKLWRVSDGTELTTLVRPTSTATQRPVYDVAFSPDGQILAAASADGTVTLWRVKVRGS